MGKRGGGGGIEEGKGRGVLRRGRGGIEEGRGIFTLKLTSVCTSVARCNTFLSRHQNKLKKKKNHITIHPHNPHTVLPYCATTPEQLLPWRQGPGLRKHRLPRALCAADNARVSRALAATERGPRGVLQTEASWPPATMSLPSAEDGEAFPHPTLPLPAKVLF